MRQLVPSKTESSQVGHLSGQQHVVHLAQHVLEEHRLLGHELHAVQLLLVEVLHPPHRCEHGLSQRS